jgi:hypothetical protein
MRSRIIISALTLFSFVSDTVVNGINSSNTTWTFASSSYVVIDNVLVYEKERIIAKPLKCYS